MTIWEKFALSITMRLVTLLAGSLIGAGLLTQEEFDIVKDSAAVLLSGLLIGLVTMAYGLARNYIDHRMQLKAASLPQPASLKLVSNLIRTEGAPPVFSTGPTEVPKRYADGHRSSGQG